MPIDFPNSPTTGQVYTYQGKSWIWNGTGWDVPRALSEIGAVQTFANAAARTAAIPSPTEGIVSYLNDSNLLTIHDGSAWKPSLATSGGILQVVRSSTTGEVITSSSTFVDTNLTATITPKSISSQILVFITQNGLQKGPENGDNSINLRVVFPNGGSQVFGNLHMLTSTATRLVASSSHTAIYTPNSLSPQTFKTQFANFVNGASAAVQIFSTTSTMVLMEIAN
jgi:hypothetical protein